MAFPRRSVILLAALLAVGCTYDGAWDVIRELQGAFVPPEDTPWYDPAFTSRHWLVLDNRAAEQDLVDFPVLVTLTPDRIDYALTLANGQDLRFTAGDGVTLLDHEVITWVSGGTSTVWVRVPMIRGESRRDNIWLYYGNPAAPLAEKPEQVWNPGYRAVWHLDENLYDSTSNDNHGESKTSGGTGAKTVQGRIGDGQQLDGLSWISIGDKASLRITGSLTLEAWVYRSGTPDPGYQSVVGKYSYADNRRSYLLGFDYREGSYDLDGPCAVASDDGGFDVAGLAQAPGAQLDTWVHIAAVFGANHLRLYVNGTRVVQTSPGFSALYDNGNDGGTGKPVLLGAVNDGNSLRFKGILDEVRISAAARSESWIRAQYLSMTDQFITYGPRQTR